VHLNYFDLDNLYKQQTSAGENLGFVFGVLDTSRLDWGEHKAPIQLGDLYPLYAGQNLTTSRQGSICAVLAWLGNFSLNSLPLLFTRPFIWR
jgi:hypothetical protein